MRIAAFVAMSGALAWGGPVGIAHAGPPACTAATVGQLSRQVDVQCECRFFRANPAAGTPAGHRWDCGILRARANHEVPATANPYPYPLPYALGLGRGFPPRRPAPPPVPSPP